MPEQWAGLRFALARLAVAARCSAPRLTPLITTKLTALNKANENELVSAYSSGRAHPGKIIRKLSCGYLL